MEIFVNNLFDKLAILKLLVHTICKVYHQWLLSGVSCALGAASKCLNDLVDIQHFLLAIFMTKTLMEKDLNHVFFSLKIS
jgi:hypothetical protein